MVSVPSGHINHERLPVVPKATGEGQGLPLGRSTVNVGLIVALTLLVPVTLKVGLYSPTDKPAFGRMVNVADASAARLVSESAVSV